MRRALALLPCAASCLLLAGCLATPPAAPPVVSSSERRPLYQGALHSALLQAPAAGVQRSEVTALYAELDIAMRRHLLGAGVPIMAASTAAGDAPPAWRRGGASHLVRIHLPPASDGRTAVQLELRDTLTRTVVWRYAGELDGAGRSPRQVADRLAEAVVHRLREDGLLAR